METTDFRDSISKVKSGKKDAAGSGNMKDFSEVWLKDSARRTYSSIGACEKFAKSGTNFKFEQKSSAQSLESPPV